jgi:predicted metal-dependent hydrolase
MTADGPRGGTVLQGGRRKAYRPMPAADRTAAFEAGLAAYANGDFFEAHELLEPAWMGAADPAERELHQGLIKLAAAYVHATRGNPLGMAKNLSGARERLAGALPGRPEVGGDVQVADLIAQIDDRLAQLGAARPAAPLAPIHPPTVHRSNP